MTTQAIPLEAPAAAQAPDIPMPSVEAIAAAVSVTKEKMVAAVAGKALSKEPAKIPVSAETIDLLEDCVRVSLGGAEKFISYPSFLEIIRSRVSRDDSSGTGVKGFSLPRNCIWIGKDSETLEANFYYPECVREITYHSERMKIVVPNILIYHKLRKISSGEYEIVLTRYFCTDLAGRFIPKDKIHSTNGNARIYLLPFTNTYSEGHMCYGYNTMPKRISETNLRPLDGFYEFLFNSPFNDDLGVRALAREQHPSSWYKSLQQLAAANKPFPYNKLRGWVSQTGSTPTDTEDLFDEQQATPAPTAETGNDGLPF